MCVDFLFIVAPIVGILCLFYVCCVVFCVISSFVIILMREKKAG